MGFFPFKDTDFGWHYRCGELLLSRAGICTTNLFSYYLPHYKWAYGTFVNDALIATIYDRFGFLGLSVLGALTFAALFFLLYWLISGSQLQRVLSVVFFYFFSLNTLRIGYRPQIVGLLFYFVILYLLKLYHQNKLPFSKLALLVTSLVLLWVNFHNSFFLAALTVGFYSLETLWKRKSFKELSLSIWLLFVGLFNPYGYRVYPEIWRHFAVPLGKLIAEWVKPALPFQIAILILVPLFGYLLFKERKYFFVILMAFTGFLAFSANRNLPFFIGTFLYVVSTLPFKWQRLTQDKEARELLLLGVLTSLFLWSFMSIPQTVRFGTSKDVRCQLSTVVMPCKAADYFKRGKLVGNVYNTYEWGGFLIKELPESRFFVDGRMPAWTNEQGESAYTTFLNVIQARKGWNDFLLANKTNYIFIQKGTFLDIELKDQAKAEYYGWKLLYSDNVASVYGRNRL